MSAPDNPMFDPEAQPRPDDWGEWRNPRGKPKPEEIDEYMRKLRERLYPEGDEQ